MNCLKDKVALVTGAGSGIGKAVVQRYVEEGARICAMDRSEDSLLTLKKQFGSSLITVMGDVADLSSNQNAVSETINAFGQLDIFVGNAGVFDNKVPFSEIPIEKIESAYDELFSINVKGYILGAKSAHPELIKTKGCMIFTSSISSFGAGYGGTLYVSSKHAVAGFVRQLAYEMAPQQIRVNSVAPGYVPTNLHGLHKLEQGLSPARPDALVKKIPLNFVPDARDLTGLYVLLASHDSRAITGQIYVADGGISL